MKKFLIKYYEYRLHQLVVAKQDLVRHMCLYDDKESFIYQSLRLNESLQELLLEIYISLTRWFL